MTPLHPREARDAGIEGQVILEVIVDRCGRVESVELLEGHPVLVEAAITAVRQWRYNPALLHGEPVKVRLVVVVEFSTRHSTLRAPPGSRRDRDLPRGGQGVDQRAG